MNKTLGGCQKRQPKEGLRKNMHLNTGTTSYSPPTKSSDARAAVLQIGCDCVLLEGIMWIIRYDSIIYRIINITSLLQVARNHSLSERLKSCQSFARFEEANEVHFIINAPLRLRFQFCLSSWRFQVNRFTHLWRRRPGHPVTILADRLHCRRLSKWGTSST